MAQLEKGSISFYMGAAVGEMKDVLSKASTALRNAARDKKEGVDHAKSIFHEADQDVLDILDRNTEILERALDENDRMVQIVPYYQDICDVSGRVVKYEALARIRRIGEDGRNDIIPPGIFIPIADENGRSADVTKIMLTQIQKDLMENP